MKTIETLGRVGLPVLLGLAFFVGPASADPMYFDTTGVLDFSENPIPADFFGPGSLPFEGTVYLSGVPFGPGGASTVIERGVVSGGVETVPIEIVALQLASTAPIEVFTGTGSSFWNVAVHLAAAPPSTGQMDLQQTSPSGGLIVNSFFDVFVEIDLAPVVPGPTQTLPDNEQLNISLPEPQFIYVPPPGTPWPPGFFPTSPMTYDGVDRLSITLNPTPEPASFVLAACGLAALLAVGRRMRRRAS